MTTVSVCGRHTPSEVAAGLDVDGALHISADELARLRVAQADHIGECRHGPILAIPVIVE